MTKTFKTKHTRTKGVALRSTSKKKSSQQIQSTVLIIKSPEKSSGGKSPLSPANVITNKNLSVPPIYLC